MISVDEILETINMVTKQHFDVRTVTLGINLSDCVDSDIDKVCENIENKIKRLGARLVPAIENIEKKYGVPIVNKRISVTPVSLILGPVVRDVDKKVAIGNAVKVAETLDSCAKDLGIDFIGGYSALVQKGVTGADSILMDSIPKALEATERVCSSVNLASTKAGIDMDAVMRMGEIIKETSRIPVNCARLVVFSNAVSDNPFMAGAFHGVEEGESVVNVGVSGPGVVLRAVDDAKECTLDELAEIIKRTTFKITRVGELIGREVAEEIDSEFGIVDLSLAPTPSEGDSVARILEAMGLERTGTHGTTAALALLTDAVKKGGSMATSSVGGLSGAFIPVSEDVGMVEAVELGALGLDKLEAMTSICSVGIDMVVVPEDTPAETLSAIIADECAIGVMNNKTTGVRIIPMGKVGEKVEFGGLLGGSIVMPVNRFSSAKFIRRAGRIPAPIHSLRN